jgi:Serine/threonine protein kinase
MARRPDPPSSANAPLVSTRLPSAQLASQVRTPPPRAQGDEARYENLGPLAKGGAGVIYRVHDRILNRVVVMKTLRPEYATNNGMITRFLHEAQVVAQLQHPAIVPVHDLGQLPDGRWFLTMKEIQGRTLRELVSELHTARLDAARAADDSSLGFVPLQDGWTFRRVIDAFRTVCAAVGFAHARGVLHRDLKPDNIMVGDFGEVLVLDWGLAKLMHAGEGGEALVDPWTLVAERAPHTLQGTVVGTPAYMASEQAEGDAARLGPWSDVWSLWHPLRHPLWATALCR